MSDTATKQPSQKQILAKIAKQEARQTKLIDELAGTNDELITLRGQLAALQPPAPEKPAKPAKAQTNGEVASGEEKSDEVE